MAAGLVTDARHAESLLATEQVDLVALARELLWNPHWPAHAASGLGVRDLDSVLPQSYAFRLSAREAATAQYPRGSAIDIPHSHSESFRYIWD
jgi:2,4-dienoyl-CoA reductase-like NADH-dependent reductase (Old Yellow Enzyme family)